MSQYAQHKDTGRARFLRTWTKSYLNIVGTESKADLRDLKKVLSKHLSSDQAFCRYWLSMKDNYTEMFKRITQVKDLNDHERIETLQASLGKEISINATELAEINFTITPEQITLKHSASLDEPSRHTLLANLIDLGFTINRPLSNHDWVTYLIGTAQHCKHVQSLTR